MDQYVNITPEALAALAQMFVEHRNNGGETFIKAFRAHCERHDWGWFAPDSKQQFNRRATWLLRALSSASYSKMCLGQLVEGNYPYWVYRAEDGEPCGHFRFDGLTLPPTHPFWARRLPPRFGGCGCYINGASSLAQARRLGGDPDKTLPPDWDEPQAGEADFWRMEQPEDILLILGAIGGGDLDDID